MNCEHCTGHITAVEMDAVGLGEYNGWKCPNCGHEVTDIGSYKMAGEPPGEPCSCVGCRLAAERKARENAEKAQEKAEAERDRYRQALADESMDARGREIALEQRMDRIKFAADSAVDQEIMLHEAAERERDKLQKQLNSHIESTEQAARESYKTERRLATVAERHDKLQDRLHTILRSAKSQGIELGDDPDGAILFSFSNQHNLAVVTIERDILQDRLNTILRSAESNGIELNDDPDFQVCASFCNRHTVTVLQDRLNTILRAAKSNGIELGDDPDYAVCTSFENQHKLVCLLRERDELQDHLNAILRSGESNRHTITLLQDTLNEVMSTIKLGLIDSAVVNITEALKAVGKDSQ